VSALSDFKQDRARYPRSAWLTEHTLWAVSVYRLGQATLEHRGLRKLLLLAAYAPLSQIVRVITSIEIPRTTSIGPGLRIMHGGPVVFSSYSTIGSHCSFNVGVILGSVDFDSHAAPTIGNDVVFGAYSMVIGRVTVGDGAFIGAMTLVRQDVPAGARAVGVPARILEPKATDSSVQGADAASTLNRVA
jgi:serine O-acetyltransferase